MNACLSCLRNARAAVGATLAIDHVTVGQIALARGSVIRGASGADPDYPLGGGEPLVCSVAAKDLRGDGTDVIQQA